MLPDVIIASVDTCRCWAAFTAWSMWHSCRQTFTTDVQFVSITCAFNLSFLLVIHRQCFDAIGWRIWPANVSAAIPLWVPRLTLGNCGTEG